MNLYLFPGHKTSRNWSKPIKWCAFFRYPEHSSASQFRMSRNNLLHLIHLAPDYNISIKISKKKIPHVKVYKV